MPVTIDITQITAPASSGAVDRTISGFGTPNLAIFIDSDTTANATPAAGAGIAVGATMGDEGLSIGMVDDDGVSTTNTNGITDSNDCISSLTAGSKAADWNAWITDGITLNYTGSPASNLTQMILFGGSDLSRDTRFLNSSATNGGTVSASLAFDPDVLIVISAPSSGVGSLSIGYAVRQNGGTGGIAQCSMLCAGRDGVATSENASQVFTNRVAAFSVAASAVTSSEEVTSMTGGYTITRHTTATARQMFIIALGFNGQKIAWTGVVDSKDTTTGTKSYTGVGGTPDLIMQVLSHLTSTGTLATDATAGAMGLRTVMAAKEYCTSITREDARTGTTNTETTTYSGGSALNQHDGTAGFELAIDSLDPDGWTDDFPVVMGAATKLPTLVIATAAGAEEVSIDLGLEAAFLGEAMVAVMADAEFGVEFDDGMAAMVEAGAELTAAVTQACAVSGGMVTDQAVMFDHLVGMVLAGGQASEAVVSLGGEVDVVVAGGLATEGAIELGQELGATAAGALVIEAVIEIPAVVAHALEAEAEAQALLSIEGELGLALLAQALAGAGVSLSQVVSISVVGSEIVAIVTPGCRTVKVRTVVRTVVGGASRVVKVKRVDRTVEGGCGDAGCDC